MGAVIWCGLLIGLSSVVLGVASYFHLSSEAVALRESVMTGVDGAWHTRFALNVGFLTTGLVRVGAHCFRLPPEPRAALAAIHGAEVGVYRLPEAAGEADHRAILARADQAMAARRWDRVVGVSRENELVAVYVPRRGLASNRMKCCVLVLQGRDLVIAGGRGNPEPLLQLANERPNKFRGVVRIKTGTVWPQSKEFHANYTDLGSPVGETE